nr:50S ribosomal protein L11 methyltransferase [uncultured Porphyromonas sp.]
MRYKQYTFTLSHEADAAEWDASIYLPILSQSLADVGFETFEEYPEEGRLVGYVSERFFAALPSEGVWSLEYLPLSFTYTSLDCARENWNSRWETESFTPLALGQELYVRAPYHPPSTAVRELLLEPRCAFGSGAHHTTQMMLSLLLEKRSYLVHARVLDVGCGTGVLGIATALLGADCVAFVDIDATAVENTRHNAELNGLAIPCSFYEGILEELVLGERSFDCLVANIHRNIILHDLPRYKTLLSPGGLLLVSGFYAGEDEQIITTTLEQSGFAPRGRKESGEWVALSFASPYC